MVGVLDHGRARYAEFPRYLPVAQALAVELPDTPSDTHRCRHFLSSREPSVWLTGTRESIKEPDDAGVLIPPAPSPPTPSKLNAQGVQEQVPTVNTFIRSHTQARGILGIHADFLMAVYGCRRTRARPSARGRDPAEIGLGQVTNVMRESGIRGVRRGRTPVATRPAKGTGGGPDLVEHGFEAEAPNRPARGRHHLRAHGQRLVRLHGVRHQRVRPPHRRMGMRHHHGHQGAVAAGAGTGDIMGRLAWRHGRSRAPFRPWRAVHQPHVHHQGWGTRHASLDRHGRRLVRQRHGRERQRRVQDRARLAAQALPGFEGPGIGDVPVGLVAGTRSICIGPWPTGHRKRWEPSITRTKRYKPPHYKSGTKPGHTRTTYDPKIMPLPFSSQNPQHTTNHPLVLLR